MGDWGKNREKLLEVKNITVEFGTGRKKIAAVRDVTFDIYRGEIFGLVGESGSGKTTIGRAIIRINEVANGGIFYKGERISGKIPPDGDVQSRYWFVGNDQLGFHDEHSGYAYALPLPT